MIPPRISYLVRRLLILLFIVWTFQPASLSAAEPADSTERDYSKDLPRIPATEPADAVKTLRVAPGFRAELAAAEPLVADPIAMAFDENGRLFVVEMRGYSEQPEDHRGQVRLLEDTDGDGRFDRSFVYVKNLSWPTAVTCWDGGVFVGVAPDILYCKDTDGDGQADIRETVYTGFARSNVQGLLNTMKWGLDQRIHLAVSSSGGAIRRADLAEGAEKAEPVNLRGRDMAFDPRTRQFAPTSGGGQHGLSFDAWGRKFVSQNSNHIQLLMFEDRYLARNPYLAAPSPRINIAADGPQADVFRSSPVEPWREIRTRLRAKGIVPGIVEGGGKPAGYFTGATGVTIYRGNAWPSEYAGYAFIGDVGSNLVHRKRMEANGVELIARRVDEKSEFVASTDIWFRPAQFANAPDGTLYIADMYREVIEHPKSLPPVIKQHLDLTSGRERGRIWRIVPEKFQQPALPKLGSATTAELVATLAHPNGWHRETAARLLQERQPREAIGLLDKLAAESPSPLGRLHALCVLAGFEALTPGTILPRLTDDDPRVRERAVQLAEAVANRSPAVRQELFAMVNDPELLVRYQLAFTLGELDDPQRLPAVAQLIRADGNNRWVRLALLSSLREGSGGVLASLAEDAEFRRGAAGKSWLGALAAQIGRQQSPADVADLLAVLKTLSGDKADAPVVQTIVQQLAAKPGSPLATQVAAATGGQADKLIAELLTAARDKAAQAKLPDAERVEAIHLLRLGSFAASQKVLTQLLDPQQPAAVQQAALATLCGYTQADAAAAVVAHWPALGPSLRTQAADVLFSHDAGIHALLTAVVKQQIPMADLPPGRIQLLTLHPSDAIRKQATQLAGRGSSDARAKVIASYHGALEKAGNAERGAAIFKKNCSVCHKLGEIGFEIGPNLAAMRNRGPEAILLNVLDPNREVNPQYVSYVVLTADGRSLSGMIAAESATSLTLRRAENKTDTVLRIDIEELKSTGLSLMPEGMEKQIDLQGMADLLQFLQGIGP